MLHVVAGGDPLAEHPGEVGVRFAACIAPPSIATVSDWVLVETYLGRSDSDAGELAAGIFMTIVAAVCPEEAEECAVSEGPSVAFPPPPQPARARSRQAARAGAAFTGGSPLRWSASDWASG